MFKKKAITILACLMITSILSGCSGNVSNKNSNNSSTVSDSNTSSDSQDGKITLMSSKITDQTKTSNNDNEKKKVKDFLDNYFKKYHEWGFNNAPTSTLEDLYVKNAMPADIASFEYLVGKYQGDVKKYDFDITKINTSKGKITSLLAKATITMNITGPTNHVSKDGDFLYAMELIPYNDTYQVKTFYFDSVDNIKQKEQQNEEKQNGYNDKTNAKDTVTDFTPNNANKIYGDAKSNTEKPLDQIIQENDPKTVALLVPTGDDKYSIGSGFFIAPGLIVTNYHVVDNGCNALIRTNDAKIYEAEGIVAGDKTVDIAVIKLKQKIGQPVQLGDPSALKKGEKATAIGSPKGLFNTVSTGIISNFWSNENVDQIQISIPITHGNSGGPLFNSKGEVVGITASGVESEGELNFAISATHIQDITNKLKDADFNTIKATKLSDVFNTQSISNLKSFGSKFGTWA